MNIAFRLPITVLREGKRFVAYSPALEVSTSGQTLAQAQNRFMEAAQLFFEEIHRKGTTDAALNELGWQKIRHKWHAPTPISQRIGTIRIPTTA